MAGPLPMPVFRDSRDRIWMIQQQPGQLVCIGAPPLGPPGLLPVQHPPFPRFPPRFDGDDEDIGPFFAGGLHSPFRVAAAQHHHERVLAAAAFRRGMNPGPPEAMPPLLPNAFIQPGPGPGLRPGPLDWDGVDMFRSVDDPGRFMHQQPMVPLAQGGEFVGGVPRNCFPPQMKVRCATGDVKQHDFHGHGKNALKGKVDEHRGEMPKDLQHTREAPPPPPPPIPLPLPLPLPPPPPPPPQLLDGPPGFEGAEPKPPVFECVSPSLVKHSNPPSLNALDPPELERPNSSSALEVFKAPDCEAPNQSSGTLPPSGLELPPGFELASRPGFSVDQSSRKPEGGPGPANSLSKRPSEITAKKRTNRENESPSLRSRKLARVSQPVPECSPHAPNCSSNPVKKVDSVQATETTSKPEFVKKKKSKEDDDEWEEGQLTPPTSPSKVKQRCEANGLNQSKEQGSIIASARAKSVELEGNVKSASRGNRDFSSIPESAAKSRPTAAKANGPTKFEKFRSAIRRDDPATTVEKFRTTARESGLMKVDKLRRFTSSRELSLSDREHPLTTRCREREKGLPRIDGDGVTRLESSSSGLPSVQRKGLRGDPIDSIRSNIDGDSYESSKFRSERDYTESHKGQRDYDHPRYRRWHTLESRRELSPPANSRRSRYGNLRMDSPSLNRQTSHSNRRLLPQGTTRSSERGDPSSGEVTVPDQKRGKLTVTLDGNGDRSLERGASPCSLGKEQKFSQRSRAIADHLCHPGAPKRKGLPEQSTGLQDKLLLSDRQKHGELPSPIQGKQKVPLRSQERGPPSSQQVNREHLVQSDRFTCLSEYESESGSQSECEREPRRHPSIFARLSGLPAVTSEHSPPSLRSLDASMQSRKDDHRMPITGRSLPVVEKLSPRLPRPVSSLDYHDGKMSRVKGVPASVRPVDSTNQAERRTNSSGTRRASLEKTWTKPDYQNRVESQDRRSVMPENGDLKRENQSSKRRLELPDGSRAHLSRSWSSGTEILLKDHDGSEALGLPHSSKPDTEQLRSRRSLSFRESPTSSQFHAAGKVVKPLPKIISTGHKKDALTVRSQGKVDEKLDSPLNKSSSDDHRNRIWDTSETNDSEAIRERPTSGKSSSFNTGRSSPSDDGHDDYNPRNRHSAEGANITKAATQHGPLEKRSSHPSSVATVAMSPNSFVDYDSDELDDVPTSNDSLARDREDPLSVMNLSAVREQSSAKDEVAAPLISLPSSTAPPSKAVFLFGVNLNARHAPESRATPPSKSFEMQDVDIVSPAKSLGTAPLDADDLIDPLAQRKIHASVQGSQEGLGERLYSPPAVINARYNSIDNIASDFGSPEVVQTVPSNLKDKHHKSDSADAPLCEQSEGADRPERLQRHEEDDKQTSKQENSGANKPMSLGGDNVVNVRAQSTTGKARGSGDKAEISDEGNLPGTASLQELVERNGGATVRAVVPREFGEKSGDADSSNEVDASHIVIAAEQARISDDKAVEVEISAPKKKSGCDIDSTWTLVADDKQVSEHGGDQVVIEGGSSLVQRTVTSNSRATVSGESEKDRTLDVQRREDARPMVHVKGPLTQESKASNLQIRPVQSEHPLAQRDVSLPIRGPALVPNFRQASALQGAGARTWRRDTASSSVQNHAATFRAPRGQGAAAAVPSVPKMITAPSYVRKGNSLVRASGLANVRPTPEGQPIVKFQSRQARPVPKQVYPANQFHAAKQFHPATKFSNRNAFQADPNKARTSNYAVSKTHLAPLGDNDGSITVAAVREAIVPQGLKSEDVEGSSASVVHSAAPVVAPKMETSSETMSTSKLEGKEQPSLGLEPENFRVTGKLENTVNERGASKAVNDAASADLGPVVTNVPLKAAPSTAQVDVAGSRLYVRRNANQLVVAPPQPSAPEIVQTGIEKTYPGRAMSIASLYVKRKTNQLVRKYSGKGFRRTVVQGLLGKYSPKFPDQLAAGSAEFSKMTTLQAVEKKGSLGRSSWVWRLDGAAVTRSGDSSSALLRGGPRLFPWKRQSSFPKTMKHQRLSFSLPEGSKRSVLSLLSKRLRKVRLVQPVYTRSANGFSLHRSGVRNLGGGNLKWTKSLEKQAKQASEEVTKAVAEAERQKREYQDVAGDTASAMDARRKVARKGLRGEGERIVWVGTERYKMDASLKTLQRIPGPHGNDGDDAATPHGNTSTTPILAPRRSIIGGTTYVRVGNGNQLVRDPKASIRALASEKVRWSLHNARFRRAKKPQYCQFFTRFGKCNREEGKCPYIHDPEKVAVCTRFLSGNCTNDSCLFTHKVFPERMPDCSYFLEGLCTNENCPYRHVSVNPKAEYCEDFLRGYCNDGQKCNKKHTYVCATYLNTGECSERASCRAHHPSNKSSVNAQAGPIGRKTGTKRKRRYFTVEEEPVTVKSSGDEGGSKHKKSVPVPGTEVDEGFMEFISLGDSDADEDQNSQPEARQEQPVPVVNATKEEAKVSEEVEKRIKPTFLLRMSQAAAAAVH